MMYLFERDLEALSGCLGDKAFITGDAPCDGDCALYGLMELMLFSPREHHLLVRTAAAAAARACVR